MPGEGRRLLLWDFTADSGAEMQSIEDVNKETMGEMYYFLTYCLFCLLSSLGVGQFMLFIEHIFFFLTSF